MLLLQNKDSEAAGKGNFAATFLFIWFILAPKQSRSFCVCVLQV